MGFGPRADLIGHAAGFAAGMGLGLMLHPLRRRPEIRARLNRPAMIVAVGLFAAAWIGLTMR
jgi:hypothetical protein